MPHRVFRDYLEREVEIDWRVWHKKILRDHGEMVDEEEAVRRTLQNPDRINRDKDYSEREVFYLLGALRNCDASLYLKVVVEFRLNQFDEEEGRLVTCYAIASIPQEESQLWPNEPS